MPFTINIIHDVGNTIFHLTSSEGIREAVVFKVSTETTDLQQDVRYQLVYKGQESPSPLLAVESKVFTTLTLALAAYEATFT